MKRILTAIAISLVTFAPSWGADQATSLLQKVADTFRKAPSITAAYTMSMPKGKTSGKIAFAGERFNITSPQLLTWYDGTTQWTLNRQTNEVNISNPTPNELQQLNPFVVINAFRQGYAPSIASSTAQSIRLILKARDKATPIASADITIVKATNLPSAITLKMTDGTTTTITLTDVKIGKKLNINAFRFNKANYPGVELVDLR